MNHNRAFNNRAWDERNFKRGPAPTPRAISMEATILGPVTVVDGVAAKSIEDPGAVVFWALKFHTTSQIMQPGVPQSKSKWHAYTGVMCPLDFLVTDGTIWLGKFLHTDKLTPIELQPQDRGFIKDAICYFVQGKGRHCRFNRRLIVDNDSGWNTSHPLWAEW